MKEAMRMKTHSDVEKREKIAMQYKKARYNCLFCQHSISILVNGGYNRHFGERLK
jgi:hypothetical protein